MALVAATVLMAGCGGKTAGPVGSRTEALDASAWNESTWISAADAPVVTGSIGGKNERAADGASWFLSTTRNEKKVKQAVWMTTGLGVF